MLDEWATTINRTKKYQTAAANANTKPKRGLTKIETKEQGAINN